MSSKVRRQAIELLHAGRKTEARQLLARYIDTNPQDKLARRWYAEFFHHSQPKVVASQKSTIPPRETRNTQPSIENKNLAQPASRSGNKQLLPTLFTVGVVLLSILLCGALTFSFYVNNILEGELTELQNRYRTLQENYRQINQTHDELAKEFDRMKGDYDQAVIDLNTLNQAHQNLQNEYVSLIDEYNSLVNQYNDLGQEYGRLSDEFSQFRTRAVVPPYIYIHGRSVELAFLGPGDTLVNWQIPFDSLEANIIRGYNSRNNRVPTVRLSINEQESVQVMDFRQFVDSQPFDNVIPQMYLAAQSDDEFIREIWQIIVQLTAYSREIQETPRYPLETLLAAGGDCEDTAILFASMVKAAPVDWDISLVYMDIYNPTDPKEVNHVIVRIDTGAEVYLVETTSKEEMSPFGNVIGWFFPIEG